jgi:trans-AT polyketide synthase, acyltransferase and oxidoreductase domains
VNQAAVESGLCESGKKLLAQAGVADVMMAPAADMLEIGAQVQVLKRGTLFGPRARKLQDLYEEFGSLDEIPAERLARIEKEVFRMPVAQVWSECERFWSKRDPRQLELAARDGKHRMALVFRWYLGQASSWAVRGDDARRTDYQIWTGPAIGAFNAWAKGSFLEDLSGRTVGQIGLNLLEGACACTRAQQLRSAGMPVTAAAFDFRPRPI